MMKEVEEAIREELINLATEVWKEPVRSLVSAREKAAKSFTRIKELINRGAGDAQEKSSRECP